MRSLSLKYRFAATVFLLEAVMVGTLLLFTVSGPEQWPSALAIAVAGMTVIAAAGILIGGVLTRRLGQLMLMAERLAEGDMSVRVDAAGGDETARLARAFNDMAQRVTAAMSDLRASEQRNRIMAERSPAAIWVFDVEKFCLIDVNENFARLLKQPRAEVMGSTPMAVSPPQQEGVDTAEYARRLIARTLAGEAVIAPWTLRDVHGVDIPCELRVVNLPMPGRTWICGIITDISERLASEAAMRHRLEFEDLITRLSAEFIRLPVDDVDGGIQRALTAIGQFSDVDRSYVFRFSADKRTFSCTHEWCAPGVAPEIDRIQNQPVATYPWALPRLLDGEVVHMPKVSETPPEAAAERAEWEAESIQSLVLVPMRIGHQVVGFVGFDSVRAEKVWPQESIALLAVLADMVANVVHRRDADAAAREGASALARANARLEEGNAELRQFAYVASHDLKAPLRTITSYAQLLDSRYRARLDGDAVEFLDFIRDAASRMYTLIDDLLRLSRLGAGSTHIVLVHPFDAIDQARRQLAADLKASDARIDCGELPEVWADSALLTQLFQNLIANAIKFQPRGARPLVTIAAAPDRGRYRFTVRDNGIGMDPRHLRQIFDIFKRLHTPDEYAGSGIGLALCRKIVQLHGGEIWAESLPGQGSAFHFTLAGPALRRAA